VACGYLYCSIRWEIQREQITIGYTAGDDIDNTVIPIKSPINRYLMLIAYS